MGSEGDPRESPLSNLRGDGGNGQQLAWAPRGWEELMQKAQPPSGEHPWRPLHFSFHTWHVFIWYQRRDFYLETMPMDLHLYSIRIKLNVIPQHSIKLTTERDWCSFLKHDILQGP